MKSRIGVGALVMMALFTFGKIAVSSTVGTTPSATGTPEKRHLNTSFDFEDQIVQGKYQYPDEGVATVENEKNLKDLLEVRKDFKDRMKSEALRY